MTRSQAYSILEVPSTATQEELKKAYRKMAMKHHPDKGGSNEKFQEINTAYHLLSTGKTSSHTASGGTSNMTPEMKEILKEFALRLALIVLEHQLKGYTRKRRGLFGRLKDGLDDLFG